MMDPAPKAMAQAETRNAPGIPLARRAEVAPAATIIPASRKPLVHRGARRRITRMEPTATICTNPRAIAIKVSTSR